MFERYTERARQVIVRAQENARALHYDYIGTEHLLLALASDPGDDVSAAVLSSLGIDAQSLRERVGHGTRSQDMPTQGQIPFKRLAKQALELSLHESLALGHNHVGTEHVLLGLVSGSENKATQLLILAGVEPDQVRAAVLERLAATSAAETAEDGVRDASVRSSRPSLRPTDGSETHFHVGPDPELSRALRHAAATALRESRDQFGLADLIAAIEADS